ncbi:thioredoxin domain-containing protein [Patescibacteria group bacterium]|nr:thioredoxin domain-containing protein [Patescibacteria group bacterium]
MSETKKNLWMYSTIILIVIFAGFIFYDKSQTFQNGVNGLFGINGAKRINITILTNKSIENPPYDLDKELESLETDINKEFENKDSEVDVNLNIIDITDEKGKTLIEKFDLTTIPVIIFEKEITETDFYTNAKAYFVENDNQYLLRLKAFDYLKTPGTANGQIKGSENPKITIVEYSSLSCGYCAMMKDVLYKALEEYPDDIQLVYKHYDRGGADLMLENAAECAGEQGKFWEMHDYIFDNQAEMSTEDLQGKLIEIGGKLELNAESFKSCVETTKYEATITATTEEAFSYSITGTPGMFVNNKFVGGAIPYETLKQMIDTF